MAWCRRAHKAKAALFRGVMRTAAYLSQASVSFCKIAVVMHACLALATVAALSLMNHPIFGRWIPATKEHTVTLTYCRTHTVFPWTAVLLLRFAVQILKTCACGVVLCITFSRRWCGRPPSPTPTVLDGKTPGTKASKPPSAPPICQPSKPLRQPTKTQRKRLYPNTPGYAQPKSKPNFN